MNTCVVFKLGEGSEGVIAWPMARSAPVCERRMRVPAQREAGGIVVLCSPAPLSFKPKSSKTLFCHPCISRRRIPVPVSAHTLYAPRLIKECCRHRVPRRSRSLRAPTLRRRMLRRRRIRRSRVQRHRRRSRRRRRCCRSCAFQHTSWLSISKAIATAHNSSNNSSTTQMAGQRSSSAALSAASGTAARIAAAAASTTE